MSFSRLLFSLDVFSSFYELSTLLYLKSVVKIRHISSVVPLDQLILASMVKPRGVIMGPKSAAA